MEPLLPHGRAGLRGHWDAEEEKASVAAEQEVLAVTWRPWVRETHRQLQTRWKSCSSS